MDEDLPRKANDPLAKLTNEDLDPLSIEELEERIRLLEQEAERCKKHISSVSAHRSAADALFKN